MNSQRWKGLVAMLLIGDGITAMVCPHCDVSVWKAGPPAWRKMMSYLDERPGLTRFLGAAEVAATLLWLKCDLSAATKPEAAASEKPAA